MIDSYNFKEKVTLQCINEKNMAFKSKRSSFLTEGICNETKSVHSLK